MFSLNRRFRKAVGDTAEQKISGKRFTRHANKVLADGADEADEVS